MSFLTEQEGGDENNISAEKKACDLSNLTSYYTKRQN